MPRHTALQTLLERASSWPEEAQAELSRLAREIEAELGQGTYFPSDRELEGVDRGLRDAAEGKFATEEDVEAIFTKHRG